MSLRAGAWHRSNTFAHADFPAPRLAAQRASTVSVCLPARNEAARSGASSNRWSPCVSRVTLTRSWSWLIPATFYSDLAAVQQPLSGEIAARRDLLVRLPFVTGYGWTSPCCSTLTGRWGWKRSPRSTSTYARNAHQPLRDLGPMAFSVLRALATRGQRDGRLVGPLPSSFLAPGESELRTVGDEIVERPPLGKPRAAA